VVWPRAVAGTAPITANFDLQKSATADFISPTTLLTPTIVSFSAAEWTTTDGAPGGAVFYRIVAYSSRAPDVILATSSAFQPVGHTSGEDLPAALLQMHRDVMLSPRVEKQEGSSKSFLWTWHGSDIRVHPHERGDIPEGVFVYPATGRTTPCGTDYSAIK